MPILSTKANINTFLTNIITNLPTRVERYGSTCLMHMTNCKILIWIRNYYNFLYVPLLSFIINISYLVIVKICLFFFVILLIVGGVKLDCLTHIGSYIAQFYCGPFFRVSNTPNVCIWCYSRVSSNFIKLRFLFSYILTKNFWTVHFWYLYFFRFPVVNLIFSLLSLLYLLFFEEFNFTGSGWPDLIVQTIRIFLRIMSSSGLLCFECFLGFRFSREIVDLMWNLSSICCLLNVLLLVVGDYFCVYLFIADVFHQSFNWKSFQFCTKSVWCFFIFSFL